MLWQSASRGPLFVCRSLTLPLPTFVGLLMFLSRVALRGLEFLSSLVDEIFGCELQRHLVLKDCRVGAFQETSIR